MKLAVLIEGKGDLSSIPHLVARVGIHVGSNAIAPDPIRTGGYVQLKRPGQLERYVKMAASRPDIEHIVVAVDLDDGCAAECRREFDQRCSAIAEEIGRPVHIVFCIREYECWFLEVIETLREGAPEYEWKEGYQCIEPENKRDAKGILNDSMARHYRPIVDQLKLTRRIDLVELYNKSRSFRRFVKAVSGLDCDVLSAAF